LKKKQNSNGFCLLTRKEKTNLHLEEKRRRFAVIKRKCGGEKKTDCVARMYVVEN